MVTGRTTTRALSSYLIGPIPPTWNRAYSKGNMGLVRCKSSGSPNLMILAMPPIVITAQKSSQDILFGLFHIKVIFQDGAMVEGNLIGQVRFIKKSDFNGIISGPRFPLSFCYINR